MSENDTTSTTVIKGKPGDSSGTELQELPPEVEAVPDWGNIAHPHGKK